MTQVLPKALAVEYQRYDLQRAYSKLEYYRQFVRVLEEQYHEGCQELERLQRK